MGNISVFSTVMISEILTRFWSLKKQGAKEENHSRC